MLWFQRKQQDKRDLARIEKEHEETIARGRYVDQLADRLEDARRRNHFGEKIDRALAMRRHA